MTENTASDRLSKQEVSERRGKHQGRGRKRKNNLIRECQRNIRGKEDRE
jgi:hypothetical protein